MKAQGDALILEIMHFGDELVEAELIFDGAVAARASRGEGRKPLDQVAPDVSRVTLRFVFDDPHDPDFEFELYAQATPTPRRPRPGRRRPGSPPLVRPVGSRAAPGARLGGLNRSGAADLQEGDHRGIATREGPPGG